MLMALLLFLRAFVLLEKLITLAAIKSITISCAPSTEGRETKKRLTLARLLKGLKTVNRRDRANPQAPATTTVQFRVSTDEKKQMALIHYVQLIEIQLWGKCILFRSK